MSAPADGPLRVLVAIHQLDLGGSQTNAVDLASGVRDRGHEVVVAGPDGPLVDVVRDRGLPYERVELDRLDQAGPSYRRLMRIARDRRPDLLHTYELTPSLLGFHGPHLRLGIPQTMTINSMAVPEFMPGTVPLQVCNPVIAASLRPRRAATGVLEIPTDCVSQHPGVPGDGFRAEIGAAPDELLVVVVSRFARVLKQQGLETAVRAAARLAPRHRMRLVLVGDGPAMPELRALAEETNARVGRPAVVLTGERRDPRSAYAAADVVVGMGGSLLRAMAFGKPCVVQGEEGFWQILDEGSARRFRWHGFYGVGDGGTGEDELVGLLDRLLAGPVLRAANGAFALALVRGFYSLEHAVDLQVRWYQRAVAEHRPAPASEIARTVLSVGGWLARRSLQRRRGTAQEDFFNSRDRIAPGIRAPIPDWFRPEQVQPQPGLSR